ncbi:MAG: hypothetical protein HYZ57_03990 [Acidobacteria bacterium]|nr:hypothetical protein [Acidobacteriota bacterium]
MRVIGAFVLLAMITALIAAPDEAMRARTEPAGPGPFLWRDPGQVEALDLFGGPAGREGAPQPPFVFQEEPKGGTWPKVLVTDANRRTWEVKFGPETKAEAFSTRLLWAVGYLVEPNYYVPSGKIDSLGAISARAEAMISRSNGNSFKEARFELRNPGYLPVVGQNWAFTNNPFQGRPEFSGLKVMMMLLSNWDVKDARSSDGPNTLIMEKELDGGDHEFHYIISDWGGTMGRWGAIGTRSVWDCGGYRAQTPHFVEGVDHGRILFGWNGKRREDIVHGISLNHLQWLMRYLGRVADGQVRDALAASGATASEMDCFTAAVRNRIEQLRKVTGPVGPPAQP